MVFLLLKLSLSVQMYDFIHFTLIYSSSKVILRIQDDQLTAGLIAQLVEQVSQRNPVEA